jgi:hypothetical protein
MDLDVTSEYVKFTLPLSAGGFALLGNTLEEGGDIFGASGHLGFDLAGLLAFEALGLLSISTLAGVIVVSAATGFANDRSRLEEQVGDAARTRSAVSMAGGTLAPTAAETALVERRRSRTATALHYTRLHVILLILGIAIAALIYLDGLLSDEVRPSACTVSAGGVTLSFDCIATPGSATP